MGTKQCPFFTGRYILPQRARIVNNFFAKFSYIFTVISAFCPAVNKGNIDLHIL